MALSCNNYHVFPTKNQHFCTGAAESAMARYICLIEVPRAALAVVKVAGWTVK